jgi:cyclic pyranopterin phosphate synthase
VSSKQKFTHLDAKGKPQMVDVGDKEVTQRRAVASSFISLPVDVLAEFQNDDLQTKKGPVLQTAILAGIMAAKKTPDLIPLCHPLSLTKCNVEAKVGRNGIELQCTVVCTGQTGVEMEALTGASVAALTIYDMCKAFGHNMEIGPTKLVQKSGGKNDFDAR